MRYADFVIHFEREDEERFRARVLESPAGQGRETLDIPPFLQDQRQLFSLLFEQMFAPQPKAAKNIGQELFRILFHDRIRTLYDQSTGMLSEQEGDRCLRLVLRLDPSDIRLAVLYSLPWELLYKGETGEFLALSRTCSIVRHLEVPRPARTMPLPYPLRVLIVFSSPRGFELLDPTRELSALESALNKHSGIEIHTLHHATVEDLRRKLLAETFHVIHFIGHGGFSSQTGDGALYLENVDGSPALVTGVSIATLLRDFTTIRLVVLNACETARATSDDRANPFSGVATALVFSGVPAVVAMQFPISDDAATVFSSTFYSRLMEGDPVDSAVTEGRVAVFAHEPGGLEWATPALFSRTPGGSVFAVQRGGSRQVPDMREAAKTAVESEVEQGHPEDKAANEGMYVASGEKVEFGAHQTVTFEQAFDGVQESTLFVLRQIELTYEQTRAESRRWSSASLIAAGFGLLMVIATLVSLLIGKTEVGTITAIGSVVPTAISGLFFSQSRSAGKRLGSIVEELSTARKMHFAQEIARTMETASERDRAKGAIVVALLGTPVKGQAASLGHEKERI